MIHICSNWWPYSLHPHWPQKRVCAFCRSRTAWWQDLISGPCHRGWNTPHRSVSFGLERNILAPIDSRLRRDVAGHRLRTCSPRLFRRRRCCDLYARLHRRAFPFCQPFPFRLNFRLPLDYLRSCEPKLLLLGRACI